MTGDLDGATGPRREAAVEVLAGLEDRLGDLAARYRDLHAHPELSGHERRTAEVVATELAEAGAEVTTGVGGHGVVGVLTSGDGPTVALRGDMDALPIREATGLPYASTATHRRADGVEVPVMHACGHDLHTTCLLGAAHLLGAARHAWRGRVLLLAQPAEESVSGAKAMVADGVFRRFGRPVAILGQHATPAPAGLVLHRAGPLYAANANLEVRLHGVGGHGARPEGTVDPVAMGAYVVTRLQAIVARETDPRQPAVVTVGSFHAGTRPNIIGEEAVLEITTRASSTAEVDALVAAVERVVRAEAAAAGAPRAPEVVRTEATRGLVNDADVVAGVRGLHAAVLGEEAIAEQPEVRTTSEDFAELGAPGADGVSAEPIPLGFWFLGVTPAPVWQAAAGATLATRATAVPGTHTPRFAPDPEPSLRAGVAALATAPLALLDLPSGAAPR
ncbi:MAG: amidohydrolase [Actinomycetota bacterium]